MVHDLGGRCFFSHLMSLERAGCGYCANLNSSGKLSELDADAGCARRRLPSPVLLCSCGRILLSHVLRMGWPILFFARQVSVWAGFWAIWPLTGLESARLGLGKFPRKLPGS